MIIPNERRHYLREIADTIRQYHKRVNEQCDIARRVFQLEGAIETMNERHDEQALAALQQAKRAYEEKLTPESRKLLASWEDVKKKYSAEQFVTKVREKEIVTPLKTKSLAGLDIPKVALPKFKDYGEILRWLYKENVPGAFPFTAGVFPFKRQEEDPKRQFAGEGTPERTNRRFHYLCKDDPAKRLSTAFDSVTLYGEDPNERPDIFGKIGESGVSVCTLDDMKSCTKVSICAIPSRPYR